MNTIEKYKAKEGWKRFADIEETVGDAIADIKTMPALIQANGGVLNITGAPEGAAISVYDASGKQLSTSTATNSTAKILMPKTDKIAIASTPTCSAASSQPRRNITGRSDSNRPAGSPRSDS